MAQNLFAACRVGTELITKRIALHPDLQNLVVNIFNEQEASFRAGVNTVVPFDGRWTPDEDEMLAIDVPAQASVFAATIEASALSIELLNTAAFAEEGIKALFTGVTVNGNTKVLMQPFTAQQVLGKKFTFFQQQNVFQQLTDVAFTMAGSLVCIIEDGQIKFKSQQKLRAVINMLEIYRAATDEEVASFANHASLAVTDVAKFAAATNQTSRKLIHAVLQGGILDTYTPSAIEAAASQTGLKVDLLNNKIVMPIEPNSIKALLQFLNESRYAGPLSGQTYVSNSQRAV
jgi:hypothetical protein